jgi:hypothetical protein
LAHLFHARVIDVQNQKASRLALLTQRLTRRIAKKAHAAE